MKKEIKKTIMQGISVSFLTGTVCSVIILFIIQLKNSPQYEDGNPRMNCFAGLGYGIIIIVHLLFLLLSLPAFFNLLKAVRQNTFYSFLSFFGGTILYLILIISSLSEFSDEDFLFIIPWIFILVWSCFYFKFRKMIKFKID